MNTPPPDHHEASREAFESKWSAPWQMKATTARTKSGRYEQGTVQHFWEHWCRALDWQASQQEKEREHACALNMDMMGTCFVCGSVNESIRAMRDEQAATEPQPDWRPLEPGEIIQEGDEIAIADGWSGAPKATVGTTSGTQANPYHYRTRRPKPTPTTPKPESDAWFDALGEAIEGSPIPSSHTPAKPTPEPQCPACVQSGCQCLGCGLVEHGMPAGQEPPEMPEPQGALEWATQQWANWNAGVGGSIMQDTIVVLAHRCEAAETELNRQRAIVEHERISFKANYEAPRAQLATENQKRMEAEIQSSRDAKRADESAAQLAAAQAEAKENKQDFEYQWKLRKTQVVALEEMWLAAQAEAREYREAIQSALAVNQAEVDGNQSLVPLIGWMPPGKRMTIVSILSAAIAKYQPQTTTPE